MKSKTFVLTVSLFFAFISAKATSIYITDGSFEGFSTTLSSPTTIGSLSVIGTNSGTIGAWSISAGSLVGLLDPCSISCGQGLGGTTPSDGSYDVQLSLPSGLGNSISLSQTLTNTFQPNSTYTLSLSLDQGTVAGLLSFGDIELRAGTTPVASVSGSNLSALLDDNNGFQTINVVYQTGSTAPTGNIGIYFGDQSDLNLGGNVYLDNFQLNVAATPEPKTESMMAVGALLMIWLGQRFRNVRS